MDRLGHTSNNINGQNYFSVMTDTTFPDASSLGTTEQAIRNCTMIIVASSDNSFTGSWTGTAGIRWISSIDFLDTGPSSILTHGTTIGSGIFNLSTISMPFSNSMYHNYSGLLLRAGTRGDVSGQDSLFKMRVLARKNTTAFNSGSSVILTQDGTIIGGNQEITLTNVFSYVDATPILSGTPEICHPFLVSGASVNYDRMGFHSTDATPTFRFASFFIQGIQFFRRKSCST